MAGKATAKSKAKSEALREAEALEAALDKEIAARTRELKPYMAKKLAGIQCIMRCVTMYADFSGGRLPEYHAEALRLLCDEISSCRLTAELIAKDG